MQLNVADEQALIGILLVNPTSLDRLFAQLRISDFSDHLSKAIFQTGLRLYKAGLPVDMCTVSTELLREGKPGGVRQQVTQLALDAPGLYALTYYEERVIESAKKRSLRRIGSKIEQALADDENPADLIQSLGSELGKLALRGTSSALFELSDVSCELLSDWERQEAHPGKLMGVPTGYPALDTITNGFHPGELILLGAKTSMGKSALALNIALNCASVYELPVAFFTLETGRKDLYQRLACIVSGVPAYKVQLGTYNQIEKEKLTAAMERINAMPIKIADPTSKIWNSLGIEMAVNRLHDKDFHPRLIIVDYIGKLRSNDPRANNDKYMRMSTISDELQQAALRMQMPMLVLSQLVRASESRADKRPQLSDLRDSGNLEEAADKVLFVHRPYYYDKNADKEAAEVIVAKNRRGGATGTVDLLFRGATTHFISKDTMAPLQMVPAATKLVKRDEMADRREDKVNDVHIQEQEADELAALA